MGPERPENESSAYADGPISSRSNRNLVGASVASDNPKDKSELTRAHHLLNMQAESIMVLEDRLRPVSKNVPAEDTKGLAIGNDHIYELNDKIQVNNARINDLINQLAV